MPSSRAAQHSLELEKRPYFACEICIGLFPLQVSSEPLYLTFYCLNLQPKDAQLRVHMPQQEIQHALKKILHAATKTWRAE